MINSYSLEYLKNSVKIQLSVDHHMKHTNCTKLTVYYQNELNYMKSH